jgi:hypothetical protein
METPTWFDLGPDYGVLELHEEVTLPGPALELHVRATVHHAAKSAFTIGRSMQLHLMMSERGGLVAWWSTERGETLGFVEVGLA